MHKRLLISSLVLALSACGGAESPSSPAASEGAQGGEAAPTRPLAVGAVAPELGIPNQDGTVRSLAALRGDPVVVYFYPRDATPGCTAEACAFRDAWARLQEAGAVVFGVSTDDVESHARFRQEHELPFDLLADVDGAVAARYGVPVRDGYAARITFLIDPSGRVHRVFEDVDPAVHVDQVVAAIDMMMLGGSAR